MPAKKSEPKSDPISVLEEKVDQLAQAIGFSFNPDPAPAEEPAEEDDA